MRSHPRDVPVEVHPLEQSAHSRNKHHNENLTADIAEVSYQVFEEISLSTIGSLNDGVVQPQNGGAIIEAGGSPWTFAAQAVIETVAPRVIRVRLRVDQGVLGLGWLHQDWTEWGSRRFVTPLDGVTEEFFVLPSGTPTKRFIFENCSSDGTARAYIYGLHVASVDPFSVHAIARELTMRATPETVASLYKYYLDLGGQTLSELTSDLIQSARDLACGGQRETAATIYKTALVLDRNCFDAIAGLSRIASQGMVSLVEDLWPLPEPEFSVARLRTRSERSIRESMTGDVLRDNVILNKWEFATGKTVLESYPWRLSVPFVLCNAQCEFCAAWSIKGSFRLDDLIKALVPVIRHCYEVDLVGWGEPLIHPQFGMILELLKREADPRARLALTTNGTRLEQWVDQLLNANVLSYAISLHATNSATHQDLMGFGPEAFDAVLAGVRKLVASKCEFPTINVGLVLVVTRQNLAEIPAFIKLAEQLGVDHVHLRTLMPQDPPREELDYHRLPPYRHPEFETLRRAAIASIVDSSLPVKADPVSWSYPLFSPEWEARLDTLATRPRSSRKYYRAGPIDWDTLGSGKPDGTSIMCRQGNLYDRTPPLYCSAPYTAFYINGTDRRVIPCVYMLKVPGHEYQHFKPSMRFEEVWNSPAMIAVRHSLNNGPLMPECLRCPFHCS
jgi:pyruvate-formate lyase-activating enzyme